MCMECSNTDLLVFIMFYSIYHLTWYWWYLNFFLVSGILVFLSLMTWLIYTEYVVFKCLLFTWDKCTENEFSDCKNIAILFTHIFVWKVVESSLSDVECILKLGSSTSSLYRVLVVILKRWNWKELLLWPFVNYIRLGQRVHVA